MPRRSRQQLLEMLTEHIAFLELSNASYDDGHFSEAKRLAVSLRVLFHQTKASDALLVQLALREALTWVDSAGQVCPANLLPSSTLSAVRSSVAADGSMHLSHIALRGNYPPGKMITTACGTVACGSRIKFEHWWHEDVISGGCGERFTRRSLVLALSNNEGGAHVDPAIKEAYTALANDNALGWVITDPTGERPMDSNPVYPAVRQISYEVLSSLEQQPELIR